MSDSLAAFEAAHLYESISFRKRLDLPPTILAWLAERVACYGEAPYLTAISWHGVETTITYAELDGLSGRLAGWLRRALDVWPGEVIGLLPLNDVPSVLAIFAIWRAGAGILLLNPMDPPERTRQCAAGLGVQVVLRSPDVPREAMADALAIPSNAPDASPVDEPGAPDPFADALFFGTSGSTAASKLVAQCHYNVAVNAEAVRRHHGLRPGDRFLGCLPIHHVNGLHFTLLGTLAAGAHAILPAGFDPLRYPRILERFRPKIASVVPSILGALVDVWRDPQIPDEFDYFVSAAAPLSSRTARAVHACLGRRVLQGYGLTETVNFSVTMPRGLSKAAYQRLLLDADIPSIGVPVFGNQVAVLRQDLSPAEPGEVGEICMRGHNIMVGYAGAPSATAEAFRGGWFHSQDLGRLVRDADHGESFLVITGRIKNIAKVRGESVSLDEMDRVLQQVEHVSDAACAALPDPVLGEMVVAAVVLQRPVENADLLAALRTVFADAVLPRHILRVDRIPRTPTGKIVRRLLAEELARMGRFCRKDYLGQAGASTQSH